MRRRVPRWLPATLTLGVIGFSSAHSLADGEPATQPVSPAAKTGTGDATERARVHYDRGIQLFNEDNYDAALFEFERAYELAPSYKILYNMGRIQRQQNNYAAAMRSFTRYLSEGRDGIPPERRKEVEHEIEVLKPRVASARVKANVADADVYSDDSPVCAASIESSCHGKTPLPAPILLNGGRHKITVVKKGYLPASSIFSVVGSDEIEINLELVPQNVEKPTRRVPWLGWAATGALALGGGIFGVLSLNSASKLDTARAQPNADPDNLKSRSTTTKNFGYVADGLGAAAIVVGAVSLYYTIKWGKVTEGQPPPTPMSPGSTASASSRIRFYPSPTGIGGTF